MARALAFLAVVVGLAWGAPQHCDPDYTCEFYFKSPTQGLSYWDLRGLCSPNGYTHIETDRLNTNVSFNICGLSPVQCLPPDNNTHVPSYAVAVQQFGTYPNNTCTLAGEGFPIFTPLDVNSPAAGINISHEAAPQETNSPFACPAKPDGTLVSRTITYSLACDSSIQGLVTDSLVEADECQYVLFGRSAAACGKPNSANPNPAGGDCTAPTLPPGISGTCVTDTVGLVNGMEGAQLSYNIANAGCLDACVRQPISSACTATCLAGLGDFSTACTANNGVTMNFTTVANVAPGFLAVNTIFSCLGQSCNNPQDLTQYSNYYTPVTCGVISGTGNTVQTCSVSVTPFTGPVPSPSATPTPGGPSASPTSTPTPSSSKGAAPSASASVTPSPSTGASASASASVSPSNSMAPSTTPTPSTTPSNTAQATPSPSNPSTPTPSPSPSPGTGPSGGTVTLALFGAVGGLALFAFGGYHVSTRMGWVSKDRVPERARSVLECNCSCADSVRRLFRGGSGAETVGFTSAGGAGAYTTGGAPASSSGVTSSSGLGSSSGFGSGAAPAPAPAGGGSSGGGYQTI